MPYQMPINRAARYAFLIAIDPDLGCLDEKGRKKGGSGVAIWSYADGRYVHHHYHRAMSLLRLCKGYLPSETIIYVEAGWLNKGMHQRRKEALPDGFATWHSEAKQGYMFQEGVDTGANQGIGKTLVDMLEEMGFTVRLYHPTGKKWTPADVKQFTGITARLNQDVRDAIRIAFVNK